MNEKELLENLQYYTKQIKNSNLDLEVKVYLMHLTCKNLEEEYENGN